MTPTSDRRDPAEQGIQAAREQAQNLREAIEEAQAEGATAEPEDGYRCEDCGSRDPFEHSRACEAPVPDPVELRARLAERKDGGSHDDDV